MSHEPLALFSLEVSLSFIMLALPVPLGNQRLAHITQLFFMMIRVRLFLDALSNDGTTTFVQCT